MVLVHKKSLGILEYLPWNCTMIKFNNKMQTKLVKITNKNIDQLGLDLSEWWIVPSDNTSLIYKLRCYYPFFDPVELDGELVDIIRWNRNKIYSEMYGEESEDEIEVDMKKIEETKRKVRRRRRMTSIKMW